MTTEERNKAGFRRVYEEGLNGGNLAVADELIDPEFLDREPPDHERNPRGTSDGHAPDRTGGTASPHALRPLPGRQSRGALGSEGRREHDAAARRHPTSGRKRGAESLERGFEGHALPYPRYDGSEAQVRRCPYLRWCTRRNTPLGEQGEAPHLQPRPREQSRSYGPGVFGVAYPGRPEAREAPRIPPHPEALA